ncbi:MAG: alpha/beta hydrolase family protein [Planctomycetota bacterium]
MRLAHLFALVLLLASFAHANETLVEPNVTHSTVRVSWSHGAHASLDEGLAYATRVGAGIASARTANAGQSDVTLLVSALHVQPAGATFTGVFRVRRPPPFTFSINGNQFTYTDAARTVTGIFVKPAGNGPFPAAIISHGQGGSAVGYSLAKAQEFLAWGMVSIAPNYTHVQGGDSTPAGSGMNAENVARGSACRNILASLAYVDQERVALWGHSKGAFVTIGLASALPSRIRAAGMSAGGVIDDAAGVDQATPTEGEASGTRAPFLMFHGEGDSTVPAARSAQFQALLDTLRVPNQHIVYATAQHNLHQVPSFNADMLANFHAWLTTHGVLLP